MLSILIPIYNECVVDLVKNLQHQCESVDIVYEIICIDDCSTKDIQAFNDKGLSQLNVDYRVLQQNVGRSRIRNILIDASRYEYLLFIDSDHSVISPEYIITFLRNIADSSWSLLYGGTAYSTDPPDSNKLLHWQYGRKREAIPAKKRKVHPANHLHTNNLLIRKSHLDSIRFDESIVGYGYEDLVFGQQIKNAGKTIMHIDNPLLHLGLKTNEGFLSDLKKASSNLAKLYTQSKISNLKIIRTTEKIEKWFLLYPVIFILTYCEPLLKYLVIKYPKQLYLADVLKLLYFVQEARIHHKS